MLICCTDSRGVLHPIISDLVRLRFTTAITNTFKELSKIYFYTVHGTTAQ